MISSLLIYIHKIINKRYHNKTYEDCSFGMMLNPSCMNFLHMKIQIYIKIINISEIKIMKKLFITLLMTLTVSFIFADDIKVNEKNYDLSTVSYNSLSRSLKLDSIQSEDFKFVFDTFVNQMLNIKDEKNENVQDNMFKNSIKMNINMSKQVLDPKQYKKYLTYLNMTIVNRNLNK